MDYFGDFYFKNLTDAGARKVVGEGCRDDQDQPRNGEIMRREMEVGEGARMSKQKGASVYSGGEVSERGVA